MVMKRTAEARPVPTRRPPMTLSILCGKVPVSRRWRRMHARSVRCQTRGVGWRPVSGGAKKKTPAVSGRGGSNRPFGRAR